MVLRIVAVVCLLALGSAALLDRENPPADYSHDEYCVHFDKKVG